MKKIIRMIPGVLMLCTALSTVAWATPLKVAATLSTFADLVKTVGGAHVEVSAIASPKFNPHFIEPRPSDVLKVKRADLFVHAGLDLELWRWPLVEAAGNREAMPGGSKELDLSVGINLLEVPDRPLSRAEGDIHIYGNPHYWLHPENAKKMAQTIADKLSELDPSHQADYRRSLDDFLARLETHMLEWRKALSPYHGKELVAYHNSWPYLMHFAKLKLDHFLEPKPGIPPTPKQIGFVERHVAEERIPAIIQEAYFPKGAPEAVAKRTGAKVVMLCQNVGQIPEASDYIAMMEYNVRRLIAALGDSP